MREIWVEAPRMEGNREMARKLGVSPLTVRMIRNRAGMSEGRSGIIFLGKWMVWRILFL